VHGVISTLKDCGEEKLESRACNASTLHLGKTKIAIFSYCMYVGKTGISKREHDTDDTGQAYNSGYAGALFIVL
jgi:hypothetical protein